MKYFIPYIEDCVHVVSRIQLISKTRDYTLLCPCVRGARTDLVLPREMISPFVARKATLCCALTAMSTVFPTSSKRSPSLNSRLPKLRQGTPVDGETVKRRQPWSQRALFLLQARRKFYNFHNLLFVSCSPTSVIIVTAVVKLL